MSNDHLTAIRRRELAPSTTSKAAVSGAAKIRYRKSTYQVTVDIAYAD
jgi:hypothetical protein